MNINNRYFEFLMNKVGAMDNEYITLCGILHNMSFYYTMIERDTNRIDDCYKLRREFETYCYDNGIAGIKYVEHNISSMKPSVLEVLVAMNDRMLFITSGIKAIRGSIADNIGHDKPFLQFLHNLKLINYKDELFSLERGNILKEKIKNAVNNWMDRNYDLDGTGGIFPVTRRHLHDVNYDQRYVELWYQMSDYIEENYDLHGDIY